MAYAQTSAEFTAQMRSAMSASDGTPVWAGIGAYRLPAPRTAEHVRTARRSGAAGVLLFSYDSLTEGRGASEYFTVLRPVLLEGR
jgi:dihydrodipicolinate synthase/N-acetylneuraminate lyase